jgi:hypothetical protein
MAHYSHDAHYRLSASIDLSGICWGVPVIPVLAGTFDGNGCTISHLTIKGGRCLGLFGGLDSRATVKDLAVVDVNVTTEFDCVGGLAGSNGGTVARCYSTGAVKARGGGASCNGFVSALAGGLLGANGGRVTQCYSTCAVSGTGADIGGLVGYNRGTVTQCYGAGVVNATRAGSDWSVGGLVGSNWGTVTQCYSTGAVSSTGWPAGGLVGNGSSQRVTASFWDVRTSGQAGSAGGTGKTTAEMQTAKTFLDAGWDFVGETANGTENIWWILEGKDYPRLWWEAAKK